jgi:hypothetical protein
MKNYIMMSIDQVKPVLFVLLDLTTVFDTYGLNIFFSRLKGMLGPSVKILEWF